MRTSSDADRRCNPFVFVLALLSSALCSTAALAQSPAKQFFKPVTSVAAKAGAVGKARGVVSDAIPIAFNRAAMLSLSPGDEVQLTLPNAISHTVVFELAQDHGGGIHSWVGYLKARGNDNRVTLTTGPTGSFGVIDAPEGTFRIVPGKDHDWLVDMAQEQLHLPVPKFIDDAVVFPPRAKSLARAAGEPTWTAAVPGINRVGIGKATPTPLATIDLMFVVTKGLANRLGADLMTRLNAIVAKANVAYADSEVGINLRLVNVTLVDYPDATTDGEALSAINPNSASFDTAVFGNIETIRGQVKADMVALMRNGGDFGGAGLAYVGSATPDPLGMYSVTTGCVLGCENVFIHELGHNMGNMHDRATVAFGAGGTTTFGGGAFPYSFGYAFCKSGVLTCNPNLPNGTAGACPVGTGPECATADDPSNFAEIMAYFGGSTVRISKFSNPAIGCKSPTGDGIDRPCGVSETAPGVTLTDGPSNTALSMNTTRSSISAFHTGAANPPGILHFSKLAYSGAESGGSVAFTVNRSNGSGGAVSVSYTLTGGSATAGTDFTATGGTVTWADNDAASKTITVPVTGDALAEGIESFTVSLSNPVGGATLSSPIVATGLILEPWPAGGVAPAGFSSAATPTHPWAVATDSFDGTVDSVSFKSAAFAVDDVGNSSTQYVGNFDAGTVTFAYRVSSYPGTNTFQFLIDDVEVLSDAGDTGWKTFSAPIAAGNHTLEWRHIKEVPFFCKDTIPAPPQGAACEDRSWIDTVVLPLQGSIKQYAITATASPAAGGTVTCAPNPVIHGSSSTCTATANAGYAFSAFSGDCTGATCTLTNVTSAKRVTATFQTAPVVPVASIAPSALTFPGQAAGSTSTGQTVTITNTGGGTLAVNSVSTTNPQFAVTHNCTTLAAAASCTASVTFTPTALGARTGTLTAVTGAGPVTASLAGTGIAGATFAANVNAVVTGYYETILGRTPDAAGLQFWADEANRVIGLGADVREVFFAMSIAFFGSNEYVNRGTSDTQYLTDLYRTFFIRDPDGDGLAFWQGELTSIGSRGALLNSFLFSTEFSNQMTSLFGTSNVRPEVDMTIDLFRGTFGRLPDSGGFDFWLGQIQEAQCQGASAVSAKVNEVGSLFFGSAEYGALGRNDRDFMGDVYNTYLRRGPGGDAGGFNFWVGQLSSRTRDQVRGEFIPSAEFQSRVTAVVAAGCIGG